MMKGMNAGFDLASMRHEGQTYDFKGHFDDFGLGVWRFVQTVPSPCDPPPPNIYDVVINDVSYRGKLSVDKHRFVQIRGS
jgi:hypothetical protein